MPTKTKPKDDVVRIPIAFQNAEERAFALAVKHAVEKREGCDMSWAALFRTMLRTQARAEGVKCK